MELTVEEARDRSVQPIVIVGDDQLSQLAAGACEARGLSYVRCGPGVHEAARATNAWAVLDMRDHGGVCGPKVGGGRSCCPAVAEACRELGVGSARITGSPAWERFEPLPGLLEIRTGKMFLPGDRSGRPVQMLEALKRGDTVRADAGKPWTEVYGPVMIDLTLNLLIDGMTGVVTAQGAPMTELDFARTLAFVVDRSEDAVIGTGSTGDVPLFQWEQAVSWLPPCESSLERFVREAGALRHAGANAGLHINEPHMGEDVASRERSGIAPAAVAA